jgi:hypothetical protein
LFSRDAAAPSGWFTGSDEDEGGLGTRAEASASSAAAATTAAALTREDDDDLISGLMLDGNINFDPSTFATSYPEDTIGFGQLLDAVKEVDETPQMPADEDTAGFYQLAEAIERTEVEVAASIVLGEEEVGAVVPSESMPAREVAAPTSVEQAISEEIERHRAEASSSSAAAILPETRFTTDLDFVLVNSPAIYALPEVYKQIYPSDETNLDDVETDDWTSIFRTRYRDARSENNVYVSPMREQTVDLSRQRKMPFFGTDRLLGVLPGDVERRRLKAKAKAQQLVNRHAACRYTDIEGSFFRYRVRHCASVMQSSDGTKTIRENDSLRSMLGIEGMNELEMILNKMVTHTDRSTGQKSLVDMLRMAAMAYLDHVCPRYSLSMDDVDYTLSEVERASFPGSVRSRVRVNVHSPVWTIDYVPYVASNIRVDGIDTICCTLRVNMPLVYTSAVGGHYPTRQDAVRAAQWIHFVLFGGQSDVQYGVKGKDNDIYSRTMSNFIERAMRIALMDHVKIRNRAYKKVRETTILADRRVVFNFEIVASDIPYEEDGRTKYIPMPRAIISAAGVRARHVSKEGDAMRIKFRDSMLERSRGESFSEYMLSQFLRTNSDLWSITARTKPHEEVNTVGTFLRYRATQSSGRTLYNQVSPPMQMVHDIYARYDDILHLARARETVRHEFFVSPVDTTTGKYRLRPQSAVEIAISNWRVKRMVSAFRLYDLVAWYEDDLGETYSYVWGAGGVPDQRLGRSSKADHVNPLFVHNNSARVRQIGREDARSPSSLYSDENPLYAHMVDKQTEIGAGALMAAEDQVSGQELFAILKKFDEDTTTARLRRMVDADAHMFLTGSMSELIGTPFVDYVALGNNYLRGVKLPYIVKNTGAGPVGETDLMRSDVRIENEYRFNLYASRDFAYYTIPSVLQWAHKPYMWIYRRRLGGLYMVKYDGAEANSDRKHIKLGSFGGKSNALSEYNEERKYPSEPSNSAKTINTIRERNRLSKSKYRRFFFEQARKKVPGGKSVSVPRNMPEEMCKRQADGSVTTNYVF